jgi:molecular chaperone DnaK
VEEEISAIIEDARLHAEEDRRRAEYIRARARLEGLVDSNQKTFNEFGSMLSDEDQSRARQILNEAKHALDSGNASECTEALEKIAEMGRILSEVILYDPGAFRTASEEMDSPEEA